MSWSIEEHIGEGRPWPSQVVVYRGETSESLAYVSGEVADRLKVENAKLRELVQSLYRFSFDEYPDGTESNFADRLRELGIEVDA